MFAARAAYGNTQVGSLTRLVHGYPANQHLNEVICDLMGLLVAFEKLNDTRRLSRKVP